MTGDRFMNDPFCRSSCIYIFSYIFLISTNISWIYLITYNNNGYINFGPNDPSIKFIFSFAIIFITSIISRCICIRDTLTIEDNNFLVYKRPNANYYNI